MPREPVYFVTQVLNGVAEVQGRAKARDVHQNKEIVPLVAKHVRRGEASFLESKPGDRSNLEGTEKLDSFDMN